MGRLDPLLGKRMSNATSFAVTAGAVRRKAPKLRFFQGATIALCTLT